MNEIPTRVGPGAHLTLHYRVALAAGGAEVISTFGGRPATLQMGSGQLAPALEQRLLGLAEGEEGRFELAPDEAYGRRHAELVQSFQRALFDANADLVNEGPYEPGDAVRFRGPGGEQVAGVIKSIDDERVVLDFNHPLADQAIVFEVRLLGVIPA